jgi:hypothetical protein
MADKRAIIPLERIESRIFFIRGQKLRSQSVISNPEGCCGSLGLYMTGTGRNLKFNKRKDVRT